MMVLAIILALILLLLATRISVTAQYDQAGVRVIAGFGLLRMKVYPRAEKEEKKKKEKKPKADKPKEKGGTVDKLKAGLSIIGPIFGQVKRRLVISELTLHYTVSMPDAAMTALAYGGAHMAADAILPMVRHNFKVKKQDIQIYASFEEVSDAVFLRAKISISVWGALCLGLFTLKKVKESGLIEKKTPIQKGAA
jgi:hypothetical protein